MKSATTKLTAQERGILSLACLHGQHLNNAEIAQCLGISVNRVKTQTRRACIKLGVHNKNEAILAAIRQGAISPTELFSLDELAELFCSLSPDMLRRIAHAVRQELEHWYLLGEDKQIICTDRKQASILTKTERNILILCARGLPNAEIADRLFITRGTVKTLVNRAWTKLGASNRAEAVIFALKQREITICDICSPNEVAKDLTMLGAETIERMAQLLNQKLVQEQIPTGS